MKRTFLVIALAVSTSTIIGPQSLWAQSEKTGTANTTVQPASGTIAPEQAAAAIAGNPGYAIDAAALAEFDRCRTKIPFTTKTLNAVQKELQDCKNEALAKSKKVEYPEVGTVKNLGK